MLERDVEAHLLARCRQAGLMCLKFASPAHSGVPDRVVIGPVGTVFVEVKRPGDRLRRLQQAVIERMRAAGAEVHVVDDIEGADELIHQLTERTAST